MAEITGGCLCGRVSFSTRATPDRVGLCHCLDCQKHHGAPFYAAAILAADAVTISGETHSYEGRHFCPTCGASVFDRTGDEIELHLGSIDSPDQLTPTYECWTIRRVSWLPPVPGTKQHDRNRPE